MDKLMKFENSQFNVLATNNKDRIMFDAETVAKSLGLTTVAKSGNVCVRWQRVNNYLKLTGEKEISKGCLITEQQAYKLAFKANNELAEQFQDWLANEVLPELRKNGEYSMKPEKTVHRLVKPYEYVEKTYNGEPVLSSIDMEHFTGLERCTPIRYARKSLNEGTDYFDLTGKELMKYRAENHGKIGSTKAAVIFTRRGFMSVCQAYGLDVQSPNRFSSNEVRISARIKEVEIRITMLRALLDSIDNGIVTDQSAAAATAAANDILESVEGLGVVLSDIKIEKAEIAYNPL